MLEVTSLENSEWVKVNGEQFNVTYKYWIDGNDTWWYCYRDIVDFIEMPSQKANNIFYYDISDTEKCTVFDNNNNDDENRVVRDFVTYKIVKQLILRNNNRNTASLKSINNLEIKEDSHYIYEEGEQLSELFKDLTQQLEEKDYEDIFLDVHNIYQTKMCKDVLSKHGIINKEKEDIVDEFRNMVYEEYEDDDELYFGNKKSNNNQHVSYKKHKKLNGDTKCPEWLKELI